MTVDFKFSVGDQVEAVNFNLIGVVECAVFGRAGMPTYWVEYQDKEGNVRSQHFYESHLRKRY